MSSQLLQKGTMLPGGVEIERLLDVGSTGEVYLASVGGQAVVVKVLVEELGADQKFVARLRSLVDGLSKWSHPAIAKVLAAGEHEGRAVVVREHVDGENATAALARGPLPLLRAVEVVGRVADALGEAHEQGLFHSNLKPSNLFFVGKEIRLVDFGLGQRLRLPQGVCYGDPRFLAPEQIAGELGSVPSDVYGVGALLFYLISGRPPFEGSPDQVAAMVLGEAPPKASELNDGLERIAYLDQVLTRALAKGPLDRYPGMSQLGKALDVLAEMLRAEGYTAESDPRPAQQPEGAKRDSVPVPRPSRPPPGGEASRESSRPRSTHPTEPALDGPEEGRPSDARAQAFRTQLAARGVELARLFDKAVGRQAPVSGDVPRRGQLTEPHGMSTGGGKASRQNVVLVPDEGHEGPPVLVGWADTSSWKGEVKSYRVVSAAYRARHGMDPRLDRRTYDAFVEEAKGFLQKAGFRVDLVAAVPSVARQAPAPQRRSTVAWAIIFVLGLLFGLGIGGAFVLYGVPW